jgi:uncharacterized protein YifN (PemK superfamily)
MQNINIIFSIYAGFSFFLSNYGRVTEGEEILDINKDVLDKLTEDAKNSVENFVKLTNFADEDSVKRTYNYLNWVSKKTNIIADEDNIRIPRDALPDSINGYEYGLLKEKRKEIVDKYYYKNGEIYNLTKEDIDEYSIVKLVKILVLKRKNVIWVDFGFNIQDEFGGKHPAIILKQTSDSLFVIPLSSQEPVEKKDYHVKVDKVYKLEPMIRWVNVLRIKDISIHRIDFNSIVGNVRSTILDDISEAIKISGVR